MTTKGFDGEVAPPPTAVVSATSLEQTHKDTKRSGLLLLFVFCVIVIAIVVGLIVLGLSGILDTRFKIESVSIALDKSDLSYNQSQAIRAAWDIGFSTKFPPSVYGVWVRCLSSYWSSKIIIRDAENRASSIHTVVTTSLPREYVLYDHDQLKMEGQTLQFDVLFQNRRGTITRECKNMSIVIPPNQTQGLMVGGPIECH